jgi:hypothetical protein
MRVKALIVATMLKLVAVALVMERALRSALAVARVAKEAPYASMRVAAVPLSVEQRAIRRAPVVAKAGRAVV